MPDWAQGKRTEINPKFDVFALGKLMWWMVSGLEITFLRNWYFNNINYPDLNVETLFPNKRYIQLLNEILSSSVVEYESQCLNNASELLAKIDQCLTIVEQNGDIVREGITRMCKICGNGVYRTFDDARIKNNYGQRGRDGVEVRVEKCESCGNIQGFILGNNIPG